jgi:SOS-response transcriptional repressor LexA
MIMTIGQRLRRAMERADLTQKEVAASARLETTTVNDIVNDRADPRFSTVQRIVEAIGTTFGELFDEPRIYLSPQDVETLTRSIELDQRLLTNDAAQKALREPAPAKSFQQRRQPDMIRDARVTKHPADELVPLPNHQIPEKYVRQSARRAFKVITDAMIGAGILEGDIIYVRSTIAELEADGEIIACRLDGALKLKRLDLRGGDKTLQNANPHYEDLVVKPADAFHMIGVVVNAGK